MGPVSGKPRSTPQGMPLTGQGRSDGLRAHPKCVVIDSDGEGRARVRESCGSGAARRTRRACPRRAPRSLRVLLFHAPRRPTCIGKGGGEGEVRAEVRVASGRGAGRSGRLGGSKGVSCDASQNPHRARRRGQESGGARGFRALSVGRVPRRPSLMGGDTSQTLESPWRDGQGRGGVGL